MSTPRRSRSSRPSAGRERPGGGRGPAAPGRGRGAANRRRTPDSAGAAGEASTKRQATSGTSSSTGKASGARSGAGKSAPATSTSSSDVGGSGPGRDDEDGASPGRARRSGLTGRAAVLALVLAALVVSYASSLRTWAEQRSTVAELREENAERKAKVAAYEQQIKRWNDPAYIEAQARTRFGWVKPGEVGYVVVDEDGAVADGGSDGAADVDSPDEPDGAWWQRMWRSVETAGEPPKPKPKPTRKEPAKQIGPEKDGRSAQGTEE